MADLMFVVFDLDGTLADLEHRKPMIKNRVSADWDGFYKACSDDSVIEPIASVFRTMIRAGHHVEIWSGRSDIAGLETQDWLDDNDLVPHTIRLRRQGDFTPDDKLKESWLRELDRAPDLVFDDRDKMVAMWRRNGIRCCQVDYGAF